MNRKLIYILFALLITPSCLQPTYSQVADKDKLGMAIDYFQSGKYHEALLLFNKLDKKYTLNPRLTAYIGVCYYYDGDYKNASKYLDSVIKQLDVFAPHERSLYYFINAESHFRLQQYDKAIPMYEQMLLVCYPNEKADALYQLGFCYLFKENWQNARDYFSSSLTHYEQLYNTPDTQSRITQLNNMIKGCNEKLKEQ